MVNENFAKESEAKSLIKELLIGLDFALRDSELNLQQKEKKSFLRLNIIKYVHAIYELQDKKEVE